LVWHLSNLVDVLGLDFGAFLHLLCFRVAHLLSDNLLPLGWLNLLYLCRSIFFSSSRLLLPLIFIACLVVAVVLTTFHFVSLVDALGIGIFYRLLKNRWLDFFSSFLYFFICLLDIRDWLILRALLEPNLILFFGIFSNHSLFLLADLLRLLLCSVFVLLWRLIVNFCLLFLFICLFLHALGHECGHHVVASSRWHIWDFSLVILDFLL
jgi:hypothetical protein